MAVRTHPGPLVSSALTADPEPTHLSSVDHTPCQGPAQSTMLASVSEEPPRPAPQDHCIIQALCFPVEGTKPALCALAFPEPGKAPALGCPSLHPSPLFTILCHLILQHPVAKAGPIIQTENLRLREINNDPFPASSNITSSLSHCLASPTVALETGLPMDTSGPQTAQMHKRE